MCEYIQTVPNASQMPVIPCSSSEYTHNTLWDKYFPLLKVVTCLVPACA